MAAASLFDAAGIYCNLIAYQLDSSGFMGLISYSMVVYAFLSDIIIFDEQIYTLELISASVILLVTIVVSVYNLKQTTIYE